MSEIAIAMPKNPVLKGGKVFSQTDEDGIISEIFRRIETTSKVFIEFGAGTGVENNSHALLLQDWRGLWVEGDTKRAARIEAALQRDTSNPDLLLCAEFVTRENVREICERALARLGTKDIDFLSMDLDGNDLHLLATIMDLKPRVLCCEYNAQLGPTIDVSIDYNPRHAWQGDDYQGMSLAAARKLLEPLGYVLVCCNLAGVNAFFVQEHLADAFGGYDPDLLFQPPRYQLIFLDDFHPRTLRFAAQATSYDRL